MALGSGKLALAASATAAALTVTLVVIATDGQRGATPGPNAAERLSVTEYQEKLREQCRDAENKLQIEQQAHPTATPLEELAKVRSEQLDRLRELNPPAEMATTHLEMVASLQARITLIQQADDAKSDKEIDERLGQADALAVKINDAFRILGVPECVT